MTVVIDMFPACWDVKHGVDGTSAHYPGLAEQRGRLTAVVPPCSRSPVGMAQPAKHFCLGTLFDITTSPTSPHTYETL